MRLYPEILLLEGFYTICLLVKVECWFSLVARGSRQTNLTPLVHWYCYFALFIAGYQLMSLMYTRTIYLKSKSTISLLENGTPKRLLAIPSHRAVAETKYFLRTVFLVAQW